MTPLKQQIIKELHAFNQLDNKIVEAFGAKEYCAKNGITYNIIEDNPVPSLESKKLAWKFGKLLWDNEYAQDVGTFENPKQTNMKKIFDNFLKQNGVETNNGQPKISTDLKIAIMKLMEKHVDLRNSDELKDVDLYHKFLDWEKEMWKLL